jgi:hypothetical protein
MAFASESAYVTAHIYTMESKHLLSPSKLSHHAVQAGGIVKKSTDETRLESALESH